MVNFLERRSTRTRRPEVIVDPGLTVGVHRFQLIAIDTQGNESVPAEIQVRVVLPSRPDPGRDPTGDLHLDR